MSSDPAPAVRVARFADLDAGTLYGLLRLREAVFQLEQRSLYEDLDGRDTEPATWHLWVEGEGDAGGDPVAVARVVAEPGGGSRIGRVATAPAARGAGLAARVVAAALEVAGRPVVLDAQEPLVAWYERFGFVVTGPAFDDAGVLHVPMRLVHDVAVRWSEGVERRVREKSTPESEPFIRRFIAAAVELGCRPEVPPARRHDYLNIAPPPRHGRGRLCSVHATTGRVEFQTSTFTIATEIGLGRRFDRLAAGEKAALTIRSDADLAAALRLATAVLAARRGTS